ncbi:MAG: dihydroorotate dehydrogenase, partial [Planctomycetia bacterium]|nr:dihydroorotate dehydrogenase [Planctomycetia bacterium]
MTQSANLEVQLGPMRLKNPVMTASGCAGCGEELAKFFDLSVLGAFVTKAVTLEPREGHPPPRLGETRAGMLNASGLANVGLAAFIKDKLPARASAGVPVVVSVAG